MGVEYELKFRAKPEILAQIEQFAEGETTHYKMRTTYFDTPSGALSKRVYTLRTRQENEISVCTLKAPIEGHGRGEWELECDDIQKAIPELCKLGCPGDLSELTAEGLIPVCGARFDRIAKTLVLPDCVLELALDEGVLMGGGKEIPLCEVEVELKEGEPACCEAYGRQLAILFGLEPEQRSKFRRALALYKGE